MFVTLNYFDIFKHNTILEIFDQSGTIFSSPRILKINAPVIWQYLRSDLPLNFSALVYK
jgi:hypothetical protein